jgi:hypothetical protein
MKGAGIAPQLTTQDNIQTTINHHQKPNPKTLRKTSTKTCPTKSRFSKATKAHIKERKRHNLLK